MNESSEQRAESKYTLEPAN